MAKNLNANKVTLGPRKSSFNLMVKGKPALKISKSTNIRPREPTFKLPESLNISNSLRSNARLKEEKVPTKKTDQNEIEPSVFEEADENEQKEEFYNLLIGKMENLPHLPKSIVRIFLSSTFKDTQIERNSLMVDVYPKIQQFCANFGLDFQVVDMRWGIPEECQLDYSTEQLCLSEIENCQNLSLGPNFVGFIGSRYGYRPLPHTIEVRVFDFIFLEAKEKGIKNCDLLKIWYMKDTNAVPPAYVLQPVRSIYPNYMSRNPNLKEQSEKDLLAWQETEMKLQTVLRKSAKSAFHSNYLSEEQCHRFFLSVTESEMIKGILKAENAKSKALVYLRKLTNFPDSLDGDDLNDGSGEEMNMVDDSPTLYVDYVIANKKKQIDEEARNLLNDFTAKVESQSIGKRCYDVPWLSGGIDLGEYHEPHVDYINDLCQNFYDDVTEMIKAAVDVRSHRVKGYRSSYTEILHHLSFCQKKCALFCGQEKTLAQIKAILENKKFKKPVVIFANSGVGKTSLLAMVMKNLELWFTDSPMVVIRFLGTSPETCNLFSLLLSVIWHIADLSGTILEPMGCDNIENLLKYFPRFLRQVGNQLKNPLVLLLDSLDQLSPECDSFDWLPNVLPSNVHLIVSTLSDKNILEKLKSLLHEDCFIELPLMSEATGEEIITKFLQQKKRNVTNSQKRELLSKFSSVPSPLYLNLLLHSALKWESYTEVDADKIPDSIHSAISQFFESLENKFGKKLVGFALGYVTVSLNGLTELELIDVLSCNNEVLNTVFEKNDPPSRKIINLPPLLWARIHEELKDYLTERLSHGKSTFYWYHRQFIEAARERYTKNIEDLHADLFEIFSNETSIKKDLTLTHRNWVIYDADRNVTPQQLHPNNKRKLECITYHLCRSGDSVPTKHAREKVFCNIHFLYTKILTYSKEKVISEIQDYLSKKPDTEIEEVLYLLTNIDDVIPSKERLAVILLANLPIVTEGSSLFHLREESQRIVDSSGKTMLIPTYNCLRQKRECKSPFLALSLKGHEKVLANKDNVILLKRKINHVSPFAVLYTYSGYQFSYLGAREPTHLLPMTDGRNVYAMSADRVGFLDNINMHIRWQNDDTMKHCSGQPLRYSWPKHSSYVTVYFDSDFVTLFQVKDLKFRVVSSFNSDSSPSDVSEVLLCYYDNKSSIILASATGDVTVFTKLDRCNPSMQKIKFHTRVISLSLCHDNSVIVVQLDYELSSLQVETMDKIAKLKLNEKLLGLQVHQYQPLIAILEETQNIKILNTLDFSVNRVISAAGNKISCFTILWDMNAILTGDQNGYLCLYEYLKDNLLQTLDTNQSALTSVVINADFVVSIDSNANLKLWDLQLKKITNSETDTTKKNLTEDETIISFAFSSDGTTLMTGSQQKHIKIWDLKGYLLKSNTIAVRPQQLYLLEDKYIIAYEKSLGMLEVYDSVDVNCLMNFQGMYILAITVQKNAEGLFLYTVNDYTDYIGVAITDLYKRKVLMVIPIIKEFEFTSLEIYLTNLSYLVFKCGVTKSDYKEIEMAWKNKGQFQPQPHPYRFAAIKIDCPTGFIQQCYRQLTDIPTLGQTMCPLQNNLIMIASRSYILLWDIPTGKCDQAIAKTVYRKAKFMRGDWIENCSGTSTVIVRSPNQKFIVVGSEDGYVFIYAADNGMPIQMKAPDTKHEAAVCQVAVSPDNKWVSSSCVNNFIKLWSAYNNQELSSIQLRSQAITLQFTPDSKHIAVLTENRNMCVFKLNKA